MVAVGINIKKIRKQNNMTQNDLANKLFVTRQTVSNWESGKSYPDVENIQKLAQALNVEPSQLIDEEDRKMIDLQESFLREGLETAIKQENTTRQKNLKQMLKMICFVVIYVCVEVFLEVYIKTATLFFDNTFYHYFCSLVRPLVIVIITLYVGYLIKQMLGMPKINIIIKKICLVTAISILIVFACCILSGLIIIDRPNIFFQPAYKIGTLGFPFVFVGVLLFIGVASPQKSKDKQMSKIINVENTVSEFI